MPNKQALDYNSIISIDRPFPLNKSGLEQLLYKNPRTERNDFKTLYLFAIATMKVAGVVFSSPGASEGRRFIFWFNSHFWAEDSKAPKFEREDFIFKEVFSLLSFDTLEVSLPEDVPLTEAIVIKNTSGLNELGKTYLLSSPSLQNKKVELL
jgi:hypothetical protein